MAVLFALFVVPGLLGGTVPADFSIGRVWAVAIRNLAFALLVLYLLDLQRERDAVLPAAPEEAIAGRIATAALVGAALFGSAFLIQLVGRGTATPTPLPPRFAPPADAGTLGRAVYGASVAMAMASVGVVEELFFRAYLIYRLRQIGPGTVAAVVLSALMFASGHAYQGIAALAFAAVAGCTLGALWVRRPDLAAFAAAHSVYNIAAILISAGAAG